MNKYKVVFGGRGAEIYLHPVNDDQISKLKQMGVEDDSKDIDLKELNNVLNVVDWQYSDESYTGMYPFPTAYEIIVYDEKNKIVWKSNSDFYINPHDEILEIDTDHCLMIEHSIRGCLKEYYLELDEKFDPEYLTCKSVDINGELEIITDLIYNDENLSLYESGDYWSAGVYFHIL